MLHTMGFTFKDVRARCYCASSVKRVHVIFKRAHRVENSQNIELMIFALTWCANIFVGCSVINPHFSFGHITSFSDSFHYIKKTKKNLYVGSLKYFSYTIQIGSNWYMDTGVRD